MAVMPGYNDDGEFVAHTYIKHHENGVVEVIVIQPRTVQQRLIFVNEDAWNAFVRAVEAFESLSGK